MKLQESDKISDLDPHIQEKEDLQVILEKVSVCLTNKYKKKNPKPGGRTEANRWIVN